MALADDTPTEAERSLPKAPHCFPSAIVFRPVCPDPCPAHRSSRDQLRFSTFSTFAAFQIPLETFFETSNWTACLCPVNTAYRLSVRIFPPEMDRFHSKSWLLSTTTFTNFVRFYVYFQRLNVMFVFCTISPSFSSTRRNRRVWSIIVVESAESYNWTRSWNKAKFSEFLVSSSFRCRRQIIRR